MEDNRDKQFNCGRICLGHQKINFSTVFAGQAVGIKEVHEDGLEMIEELGRHGYKVSPGMLYPLLHGLESKGLLRSSMSRRGRSEHRVYRATPQGQKALAAAKKKVRELFHELLEETMEHRS